MAVILVVRSGSERILALALKDLERRFPGASVILFSDPDLSAATLVCHCNLRLVRYVNFRKFLSSQFIQLCRPAYHVKAVLLTGESERRYTKFKLLFFCLFRARVAIAFNENGDSFEINPGNWRIMADHLAYRLSQGQGLGIGKGLGGIVRASIGLVALPIALARLACSLAFIFARKWYFVVAHRKGDVSSSPDSFTG